jgi:hypothetical protein
MQEDRVQAGVDTHKNKAGRRRRASKEGAVQTYFLPLYLRNLIVK